MIYVLGTGYVAQAFAKHLIIASIPHRLISRKEVPYTDPAALAEFLTKHPPSLLINAAGFVGKPNVDDCEKHKLATLYGNAILPGFIGEICSGLKIPWVHVSSACIFSGEKRIRWTPPRPIDPDFGKVKEPEFEFIGYTENEVPNFTFRDRYCSYYSGTKAMGEELITKFDNVWICRLRMPFNQIDGPRNYLSKLARYEKQINVGNSVTQIDEFASAVMALWNQKAPYGIYHITNPGVVIVRDVVQKLISAGIRKIEPDWINMDQFMQLVEAPRANCLIDSTKIANIHPLTEINEAIDKAIKFWVPST